MKKNINSTEIAHIAGVSRSTVSRVINGYTNVPEKTRALVMKVINEHNYYPSFSGQVLAGKRTGTLGFFWVLNGSISGDNLSSSYFMHVVETAAEMGYLVLTCIVSNLRDEENINWIKRIFMQDRVDAGIFIGTNNNEPLIEELIDSGKIVGVFDHFHQDRSEPNRVSVNFERNTGEKVIDYVYGLGHRHIGIIDGDMKRYSSIKRHESFLRAMQKHNVEIRSEWMYYGGVTAKGGYAAMRAMLSSCDEYPTVICANNDSCAFGVYQALREAGLSIPGDLSIIGIDGHRQGLTQDPPLTSFGFDIRMIISSLVTRTISVIESREDTPLTEFFDSFLIERASCLRIACENGDMRS